MRVGIILQTFGNIQNMAQSFNREKAALILAEAAIHGDIKAASKWEISQRTIANYRHRMRADDELLNLFTIRRDQLLSSWALLAAVI